MTDRRTLLKGLGGTAALTSLSGCALLDIGDDEGEAGDSEPSEANQEVPDESVKIAFADLQSGPGAVFGENAINTAKLLVEDINQNGGILGQRKIDPTYIDSSAGPEEMVDKVRTLVSEEDIDLLTGFTSSATALAVSPLAEDLGLPVIFQSTGTTEMFQGEGEDFEYIFRTGGNLVVDSVSAAHLVAERFPDTQTVATINEDYVYGQNNTETFTTALQGLRPDIEVVDRRFTDFQAQDYTGHISALNDTNPDFIYSSLWGGGGMSFVRQANSQGLFKDTEVAFGAGEHVIQNMGKDMPEGIWYGGRGPHYWSFQYNVNPARTQFVDAYREEFDRYPTQAAFHQWKAVNWYVRGVERYHTITGGYPNNDQLSDAMLSTSMQSPGGFTTVPTRQAKPPGYYGKTTHSDDFDFALLTDHFMTAPEETHPPVGVDTMEWIESLGSDVGRE